MIRTDGFVGLDDVVGHPAQGFIEHAVSEQLVDGTANGFKPDRLLTRAEMADFLTLGAGIRQSNDAADKTFVDVKTANSASVNAVTQTGGALKDRAQQQAPVMSASGSTFDPKGKVSKLDVAYSLMQSLGLEGVDSSYDGTNVTATFGDERVVIADQDSIPEGLKHYVQHAIDRGVLGVSFSVEQGPFDLEPTIVAHFSPQELMSRADFAVAMSRYYLSQTN